MEQRGGQEHEMHVGPSDPLSLRQRHRRSLHENERLLDLLSCAVFCDLAN